MILLFAEKSPRKGTHSWICRRLHPDPLLRVLKQISKEFLLVDKIVDKCNYDALTKTLSKKLKLLKFRNILLVQLGQFMFSFKNSILPPIFENIFVTTN